MILKIWLLYLSAKQRAVKTNFRGLSRSDVLRYSEDILLGLLYPWKMGSMCCPATSISTNLRCLKSYLYVAYVKSDTQVLSHRQLINATGTAFAVRIRLHFLQLCKASRNNMFLIGVSIKQTNVSTKGVHSFRRLHFRTDVQQSGETITR